MNDDFWKALIRGLTPESPKQADYWWKVPLIVMLIALVVSALL